MALQMKPFDQRDWMTFAGAEKFADGSEPRIATIKLIDPTGKPSEAELVYDASGLHIAGSTFNDEEFYFSKSEKESARIPALLKALETGNVDFETLKGLGFRTMFGESRTKVLNLVNESLRIMEGSNFHNITSAAISPLEDSEEFEEFLTGDSKKKLLDYLGVSTKNQGSIIYSTDLEPEEMYATSKYGDFNTQIKVEAPAGRSPDGYWAGTIVVNGKTIKAIKQQNASPLSFIVNSSDLKGLKELQETTLNKNKLHELHELVNEAVKLIK